MKKRVIQRMMSLLLTSAMIVSPFSSQIVSADTTESLVPAYCWDFEQVNDQSVQNTGSVSDGTATMQGTATVNAEPILVDDNLYSEEDNHVLSLLGGTKGSSYVQLPSDLYSGVNAETGVTWSFWLNVASDISRYARVFSSTDSTNGYEFSYVPHTDDKLWNLLISGDDMYCEVYEAEPEMDVWKYITVTVSGDAVVFYENGAPVSSVSSEYWGNKENLKSGLNRLETLVNNALGTTCSGWNDDDCKVRLDDVALYKRTLSAEEVKQLAESYGISEEDSKEETDPVPGDVLSIGTPEELVSFAASVTNGSTYEGQTVVLTADIDMSGINFTPIGNLDHPFDGVFDGQGFAIENLTIQKYRIPAGSFWCDQTRYSKES